MDQQLLDKIKKVGDLYGLLKLEQTDELNKIRKAYKEQSLIYHPDKNKDPSAKDIFLRLTMARDILLDKDSKDSYDKYIKNQKYHDERVTSLNHERKKFADDILQREKAEEERLKQETQQKASKNSKYYEEMEKMKKDWKEDEEKRKKDLETKKQKQEESKEYAMIKVKWSKNVNISYTESILNMMFKVYGEIKDVVIIPQKRKAMIEFRHRLSAEKAFEDNKDKVVDDGLTVKLAIKGEKKKNDEEKPDKKAKADPTIVTSDNLNKIAGLINRTSKDILGSYTSGAKRFEEKQKLIREMLEKEGLEI